jgi:hypothetical protein
MKDEQERISQNLLEAAQNNDLEKIRLTARTVEDINYTNKFGNTALTLAAFKGHHQAVQLLLARGADVNHANSRGDTALMLASFGGACRPEAVGAVKVLITRGADVNHANNEGNTALTLAAHGGHTKTVQLLLKKGANINHANNEGKTALDLAEERCERCASQKKKHLSQTVALIKEFKDKAETTQGILSRTHFIDEAGNVQQGYTSSSIRELGQSKQHPHP